MSKTEPFATAPGVSPAILSKLEEVWPLVGDELVKLEPQSRARRITLERAFNFRDLGGYVGREGRTVEWGRLYRADGIHRIAGADTPNVVAMAGNAMLTMESSEITKTPAAPIQRLTRVYYGQPSCPTPSAGRSSSPER